MNYISRTRRTGSARIAGDFARMARRGALSWAAKWIETSAKLNGNPAVIEFAANMAMTIRAKRDNP